MKLVLASQNPHKIRELRSVLPEHWELLTPTDLGIAGELLEEGVTLYENAQQKAEFLWRACGLPSLADDSGLEVDFLDGMPGVHSAYFAGPQKSDSDNRAKLLLHMKGAVERKARFKTVLAWTTQAGTSLYLGQAERANQTIIKYLNSFTNDSTLDWEDYLYPLMFYYNTSFHRSIENPGRQRSDSRRNISEG